MFLAIEGPDGAGKSTLTGAIADELRSRSVPVHQTREPTDSPLGRLIREAGDELTGRALALACAADRHDHLSREIEPSLAAGTWVVSDRYVPSSLVLQRIDGLSLAEIWSYNSWSRRPDLVVYLSVDLDLLDRRLGSRVTRSRLERAASGRDQLRLYDEARAFLAARHWPQLVVDCESLEPRSLARYVLGHVPGRD